MALLVAAAWVTTIVLMAAGHHEAPASVDRDLTQSGHRVRESSTLGRTAWRRNAGKGIHRPTLGEGPAVSIRPLIIRGPRPQVHLNPRGSMGGRRVLSPPQAQCQAPGSGETSGGTVRSSMPGSRTS
jgi:hypothetical protein